MQNENNNLVFLVHLIASLPWTELFAFSTIGHVHQTGRSDTGNRLTVKPDTDDILFASESPTTCSLVVTVYRVNRHRVDRFTEETHPPTKL
jgi:hypothetical protein